MMRPVVLPLLMALSAAVPLGGCGLAGGDFPSLLPRPEEMPREIAVVDAGPAVLSEEEAARLDGDLRADRAALGEARAAIAAAEQALQSALARARGSAWGSLAWTDAQVALSRFQEERFPLSALRLRLDAARMMVDPLAEADPARRAVEELAAEVLALDTRTAATAEAAVRALER